MRILPQHVTILTAAHEQHVLHAFISCTMSCVVTTTSKILWPSFFPYLFQFLFYLGSSLFFMHGSLLQGVVVVVLYTYITLHFTAS